VLIFMVVSNNVEEPEGRIRKWLDQLISFRLSIPTESIEESEEFSVELPDRRVLVRLPQLLGLVDRIQGLGPLSVPTALHSLDSSTGPSSSRTIRLGRNPFVCCHRERWASKSPV